MHLPTLALCAAMTLAVPAWAGKASWYGDKFHGRMTASGEVYDQHAATCAHRTLPFGSIVRVRNLDNGRSAVCRVADRGPYVPGRVIDVSRAVAARLGMIEAGVARVKLTIIH